MSVPRIHHDLLDEWLDIGLPAGGEGGALYTAGNGRSTWDPTIHGDPIVDEERFAYPGLHGSFSHIHGARHAEIVLEGVLRVSDAGRAAILQQRLRWRTSRGECTLHDFDGSAWASCRLAAFEIGKWVAIQPDGLIAWSAPYQIVLHQLDPGDGVL